MKIVVGSDEKTHLTKLVVGELKKRGYKVILCGALVKPKALWPDVAVEVAKKIASGECDEGILFCWTGTGVTIAANKIPGIRAALCADAETAKGARLFNHANVLVMSLRLTSEQVAKEILDAWFSSEFSKEKEDIKCVEKIEKLDSKKP